MSANLALLDDPEVRTAFTRWTQATERFQIAGQFFARGDATELDRARDEMHDAARAIDVLVGEAEARKLRGQAHKIDLRSKGETMGTENGTHDRCLNCSGVARSRGLCTKCYPKVYARVRAGETTWEELIAEGKATAPAREIAKVEPEPETEEDEEDESGDESDEPEAATDEEEDEEEEPEAESEEVEEGDEAADPIEALQNCVGWLEPLTPEMQRANVRWLAERFGA